MRKLWFAAAGAAVLMFGAAAQAQPACPSPDFDAFIKAFQEDVALQKAFTARPLESVMIDGNADPEPAPKTEMLNDAQIKFPLMGNVAMQAQEGLKSEVTVIGADREFKLFVPDSGIQIRYLFRQKSDASCWELYQVADDTF